MTNISGFSPRFSGTFTYGGTYSVYDGDPILKLRKGVESLDPNVKVNVYRQTDGHVESGGFEDSFNVTVTRYDKSPDAEGAKVLREDSFSLSSMGLLQRLYVLARAKRI